MNQFTLSQFASKDDMYRAMQAEIDGLNTKLQCKGCAVQQGTHAPAGTLHQIAEPQKFMGDSQMRRAFELEHGGDWADPDWRRETGIWASAWHKATAAAAPQAVQAAVPVGWVPCVITYEGQEPEEIAYGPQIMMDRLKKWLDRYFEMRAAAPAHPAEAVPAKNEWEGIHTMPTCDDLIWLYCQDTNAIDGPIAPDPSLEQYGWTHWAYATAPSTAVIDGALDAAHPTQQELEQDAARYRWLRNESWACYNLAKKKPEVALVATVCDGAGNIKTILAEEAMDDAIDAALAAQAKQGEQANG